MPRPHAKYTGTVYPYIPGSGRYVKPSLEKPLHSYLLLATSCVEVIIICIYSVVQRATYVMYDSKVAHISNLGM